MPTDDLQQLWQRQPLTPMAIDLDRLRRSASCLERRVRARNWRETIAGVIAIGLLAWFNFGKVDLLDRASYLLLMAGMVFVLWHLWRHGRASALSAGISPTDAVTFHCRELARQRDLLRGVFRWYLAPFLPGWALCAISVSRRSWVSVGTLVLFVGAAIWFTLWLNGKAADRLDRQIAELSRAKEEE